MADEWAFVETSVLYQGIRFLGNNNWDAIKEDPRFGPYLLNRTADDCRNKFYIDFERLFFASIQGVDAEHPTLAHFGLDLDLDFGDLDNAIDFEDFDVVQFDHILNDQLVNGGGHLVNGGGQLVNGGGQLLNGVELVNGGGQPVNGGQLPLPPPGHHEEVHEEEVHEEVHEEEVHEEVHEEEVHEEEGHQIHLLEDMLNSVEANNATLNGLSNSILLLNERVNQIDV